MNEKHTYLVPYDGQKVNFKLAHINKYLPYRLSCIDVKTNPIFAFLIKRLQFSVMNFNIKASSYV